MLQHVHLDRQVIWCFWIEVPGEREHIEVLTAGVGIIELPIQELDRKAEWRVVVHIVQHPGLRRVIKQAIAPRMLV